MVQKLAEFFDSILFFIVSYPVTVFNLIFSPRKVLGPKPAQLTCPPGIAIALSIFLAWSAGRVIDMIRFGIGFVPPAQNVLLISLFVVAVVSLVLLGVVRGLFRLRTVDDNLVSDMGFLSYPISIGLVTKALVGVFSVNFPAATIWLAEYVGDPVALGRVADNYTRKFVVAADTIAMWPVLIASAWAFFNVVRIRCAATAARSVLATFTALISLALVMIVFVIAMDRTGKNIISLKYKEEPKKQESPSRPLP
jgi:hypothetical protein